MDAKNMEKLKDLKFREETLQNIKRSLGRHICSTKKQARMATEHARKAEAGVSSVPRQRCYHLEEARTQDG